MSQSASVVPIRFTPDMEMKDPHEAETIDGLIRTLDQISHTTYAHSGHGLRGVHAKGHGVLRGKLTVLDGLPEELAQGMFAEPRAFQAALRLFTIPGDILSDNISTPRGLAVKVMGVAGARLPGSEGATTQDLIGVNAPAFGAPNPGRFLGALKLVAGTTDKAPRLKEAVSLLARGAEAVIEAFGGKSAAIVSLGGQRPTHILGETFYSQAPILYGPYVAKYCFAPVGDLTALTRVTVDTAHDPDALRDAVAVYFTHQVGTWELRVQLCTDLATMPIEDASVEWPESESPYRAVARLEVPPQESWSVANVATIDDGMAFSPWHGIAAHRPLGGVMRARKATYANSAALRAARNGCPIQEPQDLPAP